MQIGKNKTLTIAITALFIFSMTASIMLIPSASAHGPGLTAAQGGNVPWVIPTYAYITAAPNPIGVGQTTYIIMFLDKLWDNTLTANTYRFHGYQLIITAPDGTNTTETFAIVQDTTSAQDYSFTPTTTGTYTLTFIFPGQKITADNDLASSLYINDTYGASSAHTTLVVTSNPVPAAITSGPLPTAYWTRPIYGENTNWYTLSSNWLSGSQGYGGWGMTSNQKSFPGDAVGSLTGHVMWTKALQAGGVVGGNDIQIVGNTYFEGSAYSQRYTNPIIVDGLIYYNPPVAHSGSNSGPVTCVDLQTGQVKWTSTVIPSISFAYVYDAEDPNQHGTWPPLLVYSASSNWYIIDGWTGTNLTTISNVPGGTSILGPSGEHLILSFVNYGPTTTVMTAYGPMSVPSGPAEYYLQEWNSSRLWGNSYSGASTVPSETAPIYTNGNVNVNPSLLDFNISMPTLTTAPTIQNAFTNNMMICSIGSFPGAPEETFFFSNSQTSYEYLGIGLGASNKGTILWTNTVQPPAGNITVAPGGADPTANGGKGVFVEGYKETMQWVGYSMATGAKLWGPTTPMAALDYYGNPAIPIIGSVLAYGNLYSTGYAGILYCYSLTTGDLLWTYGNGGEGNNTGAGFQTPFGVYPMQINAVGNGVVYMVTTEHTIETPLFKGAVNVAVNATTGQEIWSISGYTGEFFAISYAMADGYNTWFNGYDNSIYVVGRGPSQTTVNAPNVATTVGTPVVIRGSVLDTATGTTGTQQKGDFPNGVPCSSDASMAEWMGYVYQQQAMPTNFTGVQVQLSVLDSNGNHYTIGTATTDTSGMYTLSYTPTIAGNYTVYATFAGTRGYWPSSSETSFAAASAAPTAAPTATPLTGIATQSTVEYIGVAIIIVIVIIGAVLALLMMRKHA